LYTVKKFKVKYVEIFFMKQKLFYILLLYNPLLCNTIHMLNFQKHYTITVYTITFLS
jgi:hypothetical protein